MPAEERAIPVIKRVMEEVPLSDIVFTVPLAGSPCLLLVEPAPTKRARQLIEVRNLLNFIVMWPSPADDQPGSGHA
jgi:hypothetical protein